MTRIHGSMAQMTQPENVLAAAVSQELVFRDNTRVRGSLLRSAEDNAGMLRFIAQEGGVAIENNLFYGAGRGPGKLMALVKSGKMMGKVVVVVVVDEE
ncbi:hypothetical protein MN608_01495 [Microdochium nivale]|nr:hypothetical protein MN608_01495 [Microdochium nivale]